MRFGEIGLGALNRGFDQFPVTVNSAIVGLGNADQTLDPAALGAEDFFTDGTGGTLADFAIDDSAVTFAGAVTGGVLADGAEVLGGDAVRLGGSLGVSGVLEPGGPTVGLDLSATVATSTPDALADKGVTLDGEWTLSIEAVVGASYGATISGDMQRQRRRHPDQRRRFDRRRVRPRSAGEHDVHARARRWAASTTWPGSAGST